MVRIGMTELLAEEGLEVIVQTGESEEIVARARRTLPAVVVLHLEGESSRRLGAELRTAVPLAKVILWARDEDAMEVFDCGAALPRRISSSVPDALRTEVNADLLNREGV